MPHTATLEADPEGRTVRSQPAGLRDPRGRGQSQTDALETHKRGRGGWSRSGKAASERDHCACTYVHSWEWEGTRAHSAHKKIGHCQLIANPVSFCWEAGHIPTQLVIDTKKHHCGHPTEHYSDAQKNRSGGKKLNCALVGKCGGGGGVSW